MIHVHIRDDEHQPTLDLGRLTDTVAALRRADVAGRAAVDRRRGARPVRGPAPGAGRRAGLVLADDGHGQLRRRRVHEPVAVRPELYQLTQEREVVPEFELFDLGHVAALHRLLDKFGLPYGGRVHCDLVMGVPGGMPGTPDALVAAVNALPDAVTSWSATGIGRTTLAGRAGRAVDGRPPAGRHGGHADVRQGAAGHRTTPSWSSGRPPSRRWRSARRCRRTRPASC